MNYFDLKISVEHKADLAYKIKFESEQGGETAEISIFPFEQEELEAQLKKISDALYTTGTRFLGRLPEDDEVADTVDPQDIEEFGKSLFDFLFIKENLAHYRKTREAAKGESNTGVRLKLHFDSGANALSAIPWEMMRDTSTSGDFLVLDNRTPVVRYINLPQSTDPLLETETLNILGMISNPTGDLNVENEKKWVEDALKDLIEAKRVHLGWVDGEESRDIMSAIRTGEWHVFHYIGHGGYDVDRDEGYLVLSDGRGGTRNLNARDLSRLIRIEKLRLVLLNACEGATTESDELFSSTASTLVTDGMPAVLAMQYPITDTAAIELSRTFYESGADGRPVDYALADARVNIKISHPDSIEWATPVLFMRATDGRLFPESTSADSSTPKPDPIDPGKVQDETNGQNRLRGGEKGKVEDLPPNYDVTNIQIIEAPILSDVLEQFTIDELEGICFELGIDPENLSWDTRSGFVRSIIKFLDQRTWVGRLTSWLNENGKWQIYGALNHAGPIEFQSRRRR